MFYQRLQKSKDRMNTILCPASYHQERLLFIDNFEKSTLYIDSPVYHNLPLILKIKGELGEDLIKSALLSIVERHEVLRTNILVENETVIQRINPASEFQFKKQDKDIAIPDDDDLLDFCYDIINKPFSLHNEGLFRVEWIQFTDNESLIIFVVHHILADRGSLTIILDDFISIYNASYCEVPVELPELPIQYADFTNWQREFPKETIEKLMYYWQENLAELEPYTFHTDRKREQIHIYEMGTVKKKLENVPYETIRKSKGAEFNLFFTAFEILMHKYSRQNKIAIGVFSENRETSDLEYMVGPISNLIVMNTVISSDQRVADLLSLNESGYQKALIYADIPFDKLVLELNPKKDMSRTALFDILFHYEDLTNRPSVNKIGKADFKIISNNFGLGKYDFNLLVTKEDDQYTLHFTYNKLYYHPETAERIVNHYITVLSNLDNTDKLVAEVEFVTEKEKQHNISILDKTIIEWPKNETLVSLFEKQVEKHPAKVALIVDDLKISYGELNALSNQFYHFLIEKNNIKPQDFITLLLPRNEQQIIAILAVLKGAMVYVPIDQEYPQDRVDYILNDCSSSLCIDENVFSEFIKSRDNYIDTNPKVAISPQDIAYVIYTSGSTGNPKGVLIEHRNVVRLFFNDDMLFNFTSNDVWTMFHSYCFDFSVWEMYGALLFGGSLVMIPKSVAMDAKVFLEVLLKNKVTVLNQTPSAFYNLLKIKPWEISSQLAVNYVIFGGESLYPKKLEDWFKFYPSVKMVNMYGITETTVHVTYKEITEADIKSGLSNIGTPIPTLSCYILDEERKIMPMLIPGEVWVGGEGLSRGYLNASKLTNERFISNPFGEGRLYFSGDIVRLLSSGELEYIGRKDNQIKIRGFRIEVAEIEKAFLKNPEISEVLIIADKNKHDEHELVAYFTSKRKQNIFELMASLKLLLPHYMIPGHYVQVDDFKLNNNGKIDRSALPDYELNQVNTGLNYEAPGNSLEKTLVAIWQDVLGKDKIGIRDDFFALGGNSLKIISVKNRVEEKLGVAIKIKDLFRYSTPLELAGLIEETKDSIEGYEKIESLGEREYYAITASQFGIWFECQKSTDLLKSYNMICGLSIDGVLDTKLIESSIRSLIERHEVLRTIFTIEEIGVVQKIIQPADFNFDFEIEEINLDEDKIAEYGNRLLIEEKDRIFDLENGPLISFRYIIINKKQSFLILNVHHIICDGSSIKVIIDDFFDYYENSQDNSTYNKEPLKIQFKEYADWLNEKIRTNELHYKEYWINQLLPLPKPSFIAGQGQESYKGRKFSIKSNPELVNKVRDFTNRNNITDYILYTSIAALLIQEWTGNNKIILLSPYSVRPNIAFEDQIGMYLNVVPLCINIKESQGFTGLISETQQTTLKNYSNYYYPFANIVDALIEEGAVVENAFNVMFTLQNQDMGEDKLKKSIAFDKKQLIASSESLSKLNITFSLSVSDVLDMEIEYKENLFDDQEIKAFTTRYFELINQHLNDQHLD